MQNKKILITILSLIAVLYAALYIMNVTLDSYMIRILNVCAIYIVLALGLNLINGFAGLFSLGHAGFMAVGAYTCAILTMPENVKIVNYYMKPMSPLLLGANSSFFTALILSGIISAIIAFLIGIPALRLRDDYLAIATLGFAEIIRVIFTNTFTITNGSLGLKMIPTLTNIWWSWSVAVVMILFMFSFTTSSYGRAIKAIREDEIAAQAMGINLFRMKLLSFVIGSAMAGVGGALLSNLLGTIDPGMFRFTLTFNILLIVVLGGMGSISGSIISAVVVTVMMEALRFLDESTTIAGFIITGIPGLRMVVFSALLMIVVIFYSEGLMGKNELTWKFIKNKFTRKTVVKKSGPKDVKTNA